MSCSTATAVGRCPASCSCCSFSAACRGAKQRLSIGVQCRVGDVLRACRLMPSVVFALSLPVVVASRTVRAIMLSVVFVLLLHQCCMSCAQAAAVGRYPVLCSCCSFITARCCLLLAVPASCSCCSFGVACCVPKQYTLVVPSIFVLLLVLT